MFISKALQKNHAADATTLYFLERNALPQQKFCNKYETANFSYIIVSSLWILVISVIKVASKFPDKSLLQCL